MDPFNNIFFEIHNKNDFYGPFWIYCSMIFTLSCFGNLSSFLLDGIYVFNYGLIPISIAVIMIF